MSRANQFRPSEVFLQWSIGMIVSTPIIAILQGTLLLKDYRRNFRDAPRPINPARGVAVAVEHEKDDSTFKKMNRKLNTQERPLRLLVIGDSLAAGVGVSKSGVPVLPESIALALSKAYEGRAVYWTCVGTPGISASQIVRDINQMESHQPRRLEKLFNEWQVKRKKWQQLQDLKAGLRPQSHSHSQEIKSPSDIVSLIEKAATEWWKKTREDFSDFKQIFRGPIVDENSTETIDNTTIIDTPQKLVKRGNLFRRDSLNPVVASQYDIAVVLLGLNDLKDSFMPHMTSGAEGAETPSIGSLNHQLRGVLHALGEKMGKMENKSHDEPSTTSSQTTTSPKTLKRPLVVVPELPVAPLSAFQLYPLSMFLVPLFRAMENNKKFLSLSFPEHVVFVHQPNLKWWSEIEAGVKPIGEDLKQEESLLKITDIAQTTRERVKKLMKKYMKESQQKSNNDIAPADFTTLENQSNSDHQVESAHNGPKSKFIAIDKIHPNDQGYEVWGQHIADAIVRRWNR